MAFRPGQKEVLWDPEALAGGSSESGSASLSVVSSPGAPLYGKGDGDQSRPLVSQDSNVPPPTDQGSLPPTLV